MPELELFHAPAEFFERIIGIGDVKYEKSRIFQWAATQSNGSALSTSRPGESYLKVAPKLTQGDSQVIWRDNSVI